MPKIESAARCMPSVEDRDGITDVVVLCWKTTEADRNAVKIANFQGVEATLVCLSDAVVSGYSTIQEVIPRCRCLIVRAETLSDVAIKMRLSGAQIVDITRIADHTFIYGFKPEESHEVILRAVSSDSLAGVRNPTADAEFQVTEDQRDFCQPFSGLSLGAVDSAKDYVFCPTAEFFPQYVVIKAGGQPFFVRSEFGDSKIFLAACGELADLDETVVRRARPMSWFSRLVPLMMFLRGALRSASLGEPVAESVSYHRRSAAEKAVWVSEI